MKKDEKQTEKKECTNKVPQPAMPWYQSGLKFSCQKCGVCCTSHEGYEYVYLSSADIKALSKQLNLTERKFLKRHTAKDGPYRILKWTKEECNFLTDKGCTVYPARPMQCRTWPFWRENLEKTVWKKEILPACRGAGCGQLYSLNEVEMLAGLVVEEELD